MTIKQTVNMNTMIRMMKKKNKISIRKLGNLMPVPNNLKRKTRALQREGRRIIDHPTTKEAAFLSETDNDKIFN